MVVATFLPQCLLLIAAGVAAVLGPNRMSFEEMVAGAAVVLVTGAMVAAPIALVAGLPIYLLAHRQGWARPIVALLAGATIGALLPVLGSGTSLPVIFAPAHLPLIALWAAVGALEGFAFLLVAGASPPRRLSA